MRVPLMVVERCPSTPIGVLVINEYDETLRQNGSGTVNPASAGPLPDTARRRGIEQPAYMNYMNVSWRFVAGCVGL